MQNYEESSSTVNESEPEDIEEKEDEDSEGPRPRRSTRQVNQARTQTRLRLNDTRADNNKTHSRDLRNSRRSRHNHSDDESDESNESSSDEGDDGEFHILSFPMCPRKGRKRKRHSYDWHAPLEGTRRSERSRRDVDMREVDVDDIYRQSSPPTPAGPKILNIREVFKPVPRGNEFRERHSQVCDTCNNANNISDMFVYCQGCSLVYHKTCLGHRSGREHLVTKIAEDEFVLQCRRCVNIPQRKDSIAPDHARCQDCKESGASCAPIQRA